MKVGNAMLRRRSFRPALIYSLIIHLIVAVIMMHLQIEQRQLPFFDDTVLVEITHFQRPAVVPPKPVEPPPPEPVEVVQEVSPSTPKPKPTSTTDWLTIDSLKTSHREAIGAKIDASPTSDSAESVAQPELSSKVRPGSRALTVTTVDVSREDPESGAPLAANQDINMNEGGSNLSESSPEIGVAKLRVGRKRGETLDGCLSEIRAVASLRAPPRATITSR